MTPTKRALARQLYESRQQTRAEIARTLGVSRASIYRHLAAEREPDPARRRSAAP